MNIVIVSDYGEVNGASTKIALLSARELAEQGHRVHYVHAVGQRSPLLDHPRITVTDIGLRDVWKERNPLRAAVAGVWNRGAGAVLRRLLAGFDPRTTVVHLHQYSRALSPSAVMAVAASGLPWAFTLHDYFMVCPNGSYYDHRTRRHCGTRPLSMGCATTNCDSRSLRHKLVRLARQAATRRALAARARPMTVICPSAFAGTVARPFLPDDARFIVIPSPIDIPQAPRAPVSANRRVMFMGKLAPEKGVEILPEAARRAGVPLAFVGAGPSEPLLRRQSPEAEFHPWATRADVLARMDGARAIVFASLLPEPFGLSAMEAVARGVPVIGSRPTALQSVIRDGENGFLVEPNDVESLARALAALKDDAVADRVGEAAWTRYWADPSTPARHAERLAAAYERMLEPLPTAHPYPGAAQAALP